MKMSCKTDIKLSSSAVSLSLLEQRGEEAKFETGINKHSCIEATEQKTDVNDQQSL